MSASRPQPQMLASSATRPIGTCCSPCGARLSYRACAQRIENSSHQNRRCKPATCASGGQQDTKGCTASAPKADLGYRSRTTSSIGSPRIGTQVERAASPTGFHSIIRGFHALYWPKSTILSIKLAPLGTPIHRDEMLWFDSRSCPRLYTSYTKDNRLMWLEFHLELAQMSTSGSGWDRVTMVQRSHSVKQDACVEDVAELTVTQNELTISLRGADPVVSTIYPDDPDNYDADDEWQWDSRIKLGLDGQGRLASIIISDAANAVAGLHRSEPEATG